jgi:hypothetical protein
MRNLLAFLAAATLTVIGVGWYLDWFQFHSVPADAGHRRLSIDVNTTKIGEDLHEAEQKVEKKLAEKNKAGSVPSTLPGPVDPPPPIDPAAPAGDPLKKAINDALPKISLGNDK